jgi:hypothetical protein
VVGGSGYLMDVFERAWADTILVSKPLAAHELGSDGQVLNFFYF